MKYLFYGIWLIVLSVLQPTLMRDISVFGVAPNLFLCFVIVIGFLRGRNEGAVIGGIFGLMYDLLIGRLIGVNCLIYLYLGLGAGVLSQSFFSGGKKLFAVLSAAVATLIAALVYYVALRFSLGEVSFGTVFFRIGILEAIYNAVMAFLIMYPIKGMLKLMRITPAL